MTTINIYCCGCDGQFIPGNAGGGGGSSTPSKVIWLTTPGASTAFTPDAGCKALYVEAIGGGGGSASATGAATSCAASGGGSSGSYVAKYYATVLPSYTYYVGYYGNGGAVGSAGQDGQNTTFSDGTSTIVGGAGSGSPLPTAGTTVGISGNGAGIAANAAAANGDVFMRGSDGNPGIRYSGTAGLGGFGGASPWSGNWALNYAANSNALSAGAAIGGGGQGVVSTNATGIAGGAGSQGAIKITEYF